MKRNMNAAKEKAIANVLALSINNHMPAGIFEVDMEGQKYYVVTDSYRMVRLLSDVPALPHAENTLRSASIDRFFREAKKEDVLSLPTAKELKAWIKEKHIRRNNPGKTTFCIDGFIHVNPFYLLDMIQGLPNCKAYRPASNKYPIYFQAESGEGILCPVMVPTY